MFDRRPSFKHLALVCRSLGTTLHAGVPIIKAIDLAGSKASQPALRQALKDVATEIKSGNQFSEALKDRDDFFPELMINMVSVAENTGMLPEVLRSLAEHYENNVRLKKDFIGQITFPVVQFFAAILIIAALIFLLGIIGSGQHTIDPLGFGLHGASGALKWLTGWAIVLAAGIVAYQVTVRSAVGRRVLFQTLMRIPIVGAFLESFAVARFSWAFYLTQDAGMPIDQSLHASLKATSNGAFIAAGDQIVRDVESGESLTDSFAASRLFSEDFVQMVHVGETTGTVPETLHRLSPQFEEQARRSLRALATAAGWTIRGLVMGFIIFLILRLGFWYVGLLNDAAAGALGV
jgi:type IV pilus assembly protein PilC